MPNTTPTAYLNALLARTKALREAKGWTAEQMAKALDIPAERYRKYESRTAMPHDLVERFCLITGVTVEYLITGNSPLKGRPPPSKPERKRA